MKAVPPKKTDQKVTLAIDLAVDSGERKIGDFDPNQSLWDIIHILFDGNSYMNLKNNEEFCLIYMRKEVYFYYFYGHLMFKINWSTDSWRSIENN